MKRSNTIEKYGDKQIFLANKETFLHPNEISISNKYGFVKETYSGSSNLLVIHLQDAHMNTDSKYAHLCILKELLIQYGVTLVLIEGGSFDDASPDYTRFCLQDRERRARAKKKFNSFDLGPASYLFATDYPQFDIRGLEDKFLYKYQTLNCYTAVDALRPNAREYIAALQLLIDRLKRDLFSPELNKIEKKQFQHDNGALAHNDFVEFLQIKARQLNITLPPLVSKYVNMMTLERKINFYEVDWEREKLLIALKKEMNEKAEELDKKYGLFIENQIKAADYYDFLSSFEQAKKYPQILLYTEYLQEHNKISVCASEYYSEIKELTEQLKSSLFQNHSQQAIDTISKDCHMLSEWIAFSLTPNEYSYVITHKNQFQIDEWLDFLREHDVNLQGLPAFRDSAEKMIFALEEFYNVSIQRAHGFIDRTIEHVKYSRSNCAVLISGGFHTPTITRLLRDKNISYVVISPHIHNPTEPGLYDRVIRKQIRKEFKDM